MKTEGSRANPFIENTFLEHIHKVHFGGLVGILRCKVTGANGYNLHRLHPVPSDPVPSGGTAAPASEDVFTREDTGTHLSLDPSDPDYDQPTYTVGQEIKARHYSDDYIEYIDYADVGPQELIYDKWGGATNYSLLGLWNSLSPPSGENMIAYFPDDGEQNFEANVLGSTHTYSISWEHWPTPTFNYGTGYAANTWVDITNGQHEAPFDTANPPVDLVIPIYNAEAQAFRDAVDPDPPHDHTYTNIEYPVLVSRKSEIPGFTDATGTSRIGIINRSGTIDHYFTYDNALGYRTFNDGYDDPLQCPWCFIKYDTDPTQPALYSSYKVFLINFSKLGSGDPSADPPIPPGTVEIGQLSELSVKPGTSFACEFELKIYSGGKFTAGSDRTVLNDKEAGDPDAIPPVPSSLIYGPVTKTIDFNQIGEHLPLKFTEQGWLE